MSSVQPPPIFENLIDPQNDSAKATLPWTLFYEQIYQGDTGIAFTPNFQNLTIVGTPTITGRYYRLSRRVCFFRVTIVPGTSTTSAAGTTYIDNFPLTPTSDGICFAVSGNLGSNSGQVVASGNRIYTPSWSAVTIPLTIVGIVEVQS